MKEGTPTFSARARERALLVARVAGALAQVRYRSTPRAVRHEGVFVIDHVAAREDRRDTGGV